VENGASQGGEYSPVAVSSARLTSVFALARPAPSVTGLVPVAEETSANTRACPRTVYQLWLNPARVVRVCGG
jgi:hypothetical protein